MAIFVYALQIMSNSLQELGGKKANSVLAALTTVPFKGMLFGAGITAILQSSTLVTVMVVSLVSSSMLSLKQAASVIMGANIGTTVTALLVALTNTEGFSVTDLWVVFAVIGIIIYFVAKKRPSLRTTGLVIFTFAMILLGLALMSDAMRPLRDNYAFKDAMRVLSYNRILGVLAGAAVTAIIQSSTAATTIIVTMAAEGLITLQGALLLILGANVGTCLTAVLASIGGSVSAKRTAAVHVLFNVIGAVIFLIFLGPFEWLVLTFSPPYNLAIQAAMAHLLFSVLATAILLPFINQFVKLVTLIVPGKEEETAPSKNTVYLDWNVVHSPAIALNLAQYELIRMGELAAENIRLAIEGFLGKNKKKIKLVKKQEKFVDKLEKDIVHYLVTMAQEHLGPHMSVRHAGLLHAANDIERVSDHARNITRMASQAIENDMEFAKEDLTQLKELHELVVAIFETAIQSVRDNNPGLLPKVQELFTGIDAKADEIRSANINRMAEGICTAESGIMVTDIISNLERVGDHSTNIFRLSQGKL